MHDACDLGVARIDRLNLTLHLDRRCRRAHPELRVHGAGLANEKLDALLHVDFKSFARDGKIVRTDGQVGKAVNPRISGNDLPCETSVGGDDLDFRVGNARPARIRHGSIKVGPADLRHAGDGPYKTQ